jgi:cobalt-zinc-cadmium resistance protein CzcA
VQSLVGELKQKVEKSLGLPPGYYVTYGGAFENLNRAKARLGVAVPVSLIMIFVLLFFAFKSIVRACLYFSSIPLSAMGGILSWLLEACHFP